MSTLPVRPRPPRLRWIASASSSRSRVGSRPTAPVRLEAFIIECDGLSRLYVRGRAELPDQTWLEVGVRFASRRPGQGHAASADVPIILLGGRFAIEPIPLPAEIEEGVYFVTLRQTSPQAERDWRLTAELAIGPRHATGRELRESLAS